MSIISDLKPGLTGIAQLKAIIETGAKSPIHKILDISLVAAGDGWVTVEAFPRADHENPTGVVQAGYLATVVDAACGYAVQSVLPNRTTYATLELKVSCHKTVSLETGPLRAEGKVLSIARRIALTEAKVFDNAGQLVGSGSSSILVSSL